MQNSANNNQQSAVNNPSADEKAANGLSLSDIRKVVADQMQGYGKVDGMSLTKLVKLLGSAITGKKEEYDLTFVKDDGTWYIDMPNWPSSICKKTTFGWPLPTCSARKSMKHWTTRRSSYKTSTRASDSCPTMA